MGEATNPNKTKHFPFYLRLQIYRAFVPNGYLHIIITSYDRKPIFIENIDILRKAFKNTKTIYEFEIIAICVLPNHIHLILHPNNIEQYPKIISSIKHYFSRNVGQVCPTDNLKIGYKNKRADRVQFFAPLYNA